MTTQNGTIPRKRQNTGLYSASAMFFSLQEFRKRLNLQIIATEKGLTGYELSILQSSKEILQLDILIDPKNKAERERSFKTLMINYAKATGPIFDWLIAHRGIGDSMAAQFLAYTDSFERFETVYKFTRASGWGLFPYWCEDEGKGKIIAPSQGWKWSGTGDKRTKKFYVVGPSDKMLTADMFYTDSPKGTALSTRRDRPVPGWCLPYNNHMKSCIFVMMDLMIKANNPYYSDMYRLYKAAQIERYGLTKMHAHLRGIGKIAQAFLKNAWRMGRTLEGLPVGEPHPKDKEPPYNPPGFELEVVQ